MGDEELKFSDIKERHIYNVIFDDVRECEFDQTHLAVVLKKNNDKQTCIVAPLTSSENGEEKCNLGILNCLPENMKKKGNSFVVYNQVRTVNHSRFLKLKDDNHNPKSCKIEDEIFQKIVALCMNELISKCTLDEKVNYYRSEYIEKSMELLVNKAYDIKRALVTRNEVLIKELQNTVKDILRIRFDYESLISENDRENGILDIINLCLSDEILRCMSSDSDKSSEVAVEVVSEEQMIKPTQAG